MSQSHPGSPPSRWKYFGEFLANVGAILLLILLAGGIAYVIELSARI